MNEPQFVVQTAEPEHIAAPKVWRDARLADAGKEGCTFFRFACWPLGGPPAVLLLEGWNSPPDDQGAPRFALAA